MEIENEEGDKTRCLAQVGGGAESQLGSIRDNDYCGDDNDHIGIIMNCMDVCSFVPNFLEWSVYLFVCQVLSPLSALFSNLYMIRDAVSDCLFVR